MLLTSGSLLRAWLVLMALTLLAGAAAAVVGSGRPGQAALFAIGILTCIKARIILSSYLRLPPGAAMVALLALAALSIFVVIGSFVLFPTIAPT